MNKYDEEQDDCWAVEVRRGEPQFVAYDIEELEKLAETKMGFEQCDRCGCSGYLIIKSGALFYAVCREDDFGDETREGCGQKYPIHREYVHKVSGVPY